MEASKPHIRQLSFKYKPNLKATLLDDKKPSLAPLTDILFKYYTKNLKKDIFYTIFNNLGLNEFMSMTDLEGGKVPEQDDEKQILNIHNIIYSILLKCEMLANQKNIARPEMWLADIQEFFTNSDMGKMDSLVYNKNYNVERTPLLINEEALLNFTINYITNLIKHIDSASKKMSKKAHEAIIKHFCKYVVDSELSTLRSNKEKQIASIISAEGLQGNENLVDNRFSKSTIGTPSNEEGVLSVFGYDDLDYDGINDADNDFNVIEE
jgi:hypothetical protein